jgi:hypothetical protein
MLSDKLDIRRCSPMSLGLTWEKYYDVLPPSTLPITEKRSYLVTVLELVTFFSLNCCPRYLKIVTFVPRISPSQKLSTLVWTEAVTPPSKRNWHGPKGIRFEISIVSQKMATQFLIYLGDFRNHRIWMKILKKNSKFCVFRKSTPVDLPELWDGQKAKEQLLWWALT